MDNILLHPTISYTEYNIRMYRKSRLQNVYLDMINKYILLLEDIQLISSLSYSNLFIHSEWIIYIINIVQYIQLQYNININNCTNEHVYSMIQLIEEIIIQIRNIRLYIVQLFIS